MQRDTGELTMWLTHSPPLQSGVEWWSGCDEVVEIRQLSLFAMYATRMRVQLIITQTQGVMQVTVYCSPSLAASAGLARRCQGRSRRAVLSTLQTVRSTTEYGSLWKMMMTDADGSSASYDTRRHAGLRWSAGSYNVHLILLSLFLAYRCVRLLAEDLPS